jgi:hypothetical protein
MSVNDQLARIVKSPPMVTSPSLCRFLRYIVEETLAGRVAGIKEQVLGLEVFDRGQNFNPRLDPIVRVQARNLRSRLAKYYEGPGRGDPIRIELPKGTYIPVFHQVAEVTADVCAGRGDAPVTTVEASPASVSASVKRQIPPSFLLAALIVVMILMGILSLLDKMHFKG